MNNTMSAEEAWKLAIELRYMEYEEKQKLFNIPRGYTGELWLYIMEHFSPSEARKIIDNSLLPHINDVVIINNEKAVVTEEADENGMFNVLFSDGKTGAYSKFKKTGKKVNVKAILGQLKEAHYDEN